jgi:6-phosphogluconolactonase
LIPHQRLSFQPETGGGNSHAHSAFFSSNDRFLFLIDLGLDAIWVYEQNEDSGMFVPAAKHRVQLTAGDGPRHFCLHPDEHSVYVVNEYGNSVIRFDYDKKSGTLNQREELSTLPRGFSGQNICADIRFHPTGPWLYASNRGHDSLSLFAVAPDGKLTFRATYSSGGAFPRAFTLDDKGKYLYVANQNSDNIVQFAVDQRSGSLTKIGEVSVPTPVCIDLV